MSHRSRSTQPAPPPAAPRDGRAPAASSDSHAVGAFASRERLRRWRLPRRLSSPPRPRRYAKLTRRDPTSVSTTRLLAKAKANRTERIQAERKLEKTYVTKNEYKLDADSSKVQIAVFKMSKAGGLIESGYLALAAEELGKGSWEADLKAANLGKEPDAFLSAVAGLKKACTGGDAGAAKKAYVAAAKALEAFAQDTKTADAVKLL